MLGLKVLPPSCFLPPAPAGGARPQPWTCPGPTLSTCSLYSYLQSLSLCFLGAYKGFFSYYQPWCYHWEKNALSHFSAACKNLCNHQWWSRWQELCFQMHALIWQLEICLEMWSQVASKASWQELAPFLSASQNQLMWKFMTARQFWQLQQGKGLYSNWL